MTLNNEEGLLNLVCEVKANSWKFRDGCLLLIENHTRGHKLLKGMRNRLLKIQTLITRHYVILTSILYRVQTLTSHNTEESENSPDSPHLGETKRMRKQCVPQALLHFSCVPGTRLKYIQKAYSEWWYRSERLWPSFLSLTFTLSLLVFLDPLILLMAGPWVESSEPTSYESRSESVSASNNFSSFEMGISRLLESMCACMCMYGKGMGYGWSYAGSSVVILFDQVIVILANYVTLINLNGYTVHCTLTDIMVI